MTAAPHPAPEPPGEWMTIDGIAHRCVVLCFLFRSGDGSGSGEGTGPVDGIHTGGATGDGAGAAAVDGIHTGGATGDGAGAAAVDGSDGGILPGAAPQPGRNDRSVLLGLKRTGFGTGRIVALGGKIDGSESTADAAVREVAEESGIELAQDGLRDAGRISWSFPDQPSWNMVAFLFTADAGTEEPVASEEIEPRWYSEQALPWDAMWQDAPHWIPLLLAGRRVEARIVMAADNEAVASVVLD